MERLYVARLKVGLDKNWGMDLDFDYSVREGNFEYDEFSNTFKGVDGDSFSRDISCRSEDYGFEFSQSFDSPLDSKEIDLIKEGMKKRFLGLMDKYKKNYC